MVANQLRLAGYGDEEKPPAHRRTAFLDVETRIAANHWDNVATRDSQKTYNPTDFVTLSRTNWPTSTSRRGPTPGRAPTTPRRRRRPSRWT